MPKFTVFWIVVYVLGLLATFVNPVFGTYTYLFEYYLRPSLHWWGKGYLPDLRWNMIVSVLLVVMYLMRRQSLPDIGKAATGPAKFLVVLGLLTVLMTPLAVNPERSWEASTQYLKLILFHGLIVATVRSEKAFDGFVALHMLGAGWWGLEAWRDPSRDAGRLAKVGSGDTQSDNLAAAHLLSVIPFIAVYLLTHRDRRLKGIALAVAPFVINTIILCNSRGATLGLIAATSVSLMLARSGHRLRMFGTALAMAVAVFALADPEFISRQQTTSRYEEDGSALGRLESWRGGLTLIRDYPLGAGGNGYEELSPRYIADIVEAHKGQQRAPHNTYILVASDWGIPGLMLYLGYFFALFALTREVRRRAPEGGIWYYRAVAIDVALVGMLVAGTFSDRLYGEAPYWIGGLAVALHRLQAHRLATSRPDDGVAERVASPTATPVGAPAAAAVRGVR